MDFHAFMYVTIGRRRELERGMAGKDPVLYQRMLDEIGEYARTCDATGWSGIGIPEHHLQIEGFELGQDPGLMAMFLGRHGPRLRIARTAGRADGPGTRGAAAAGDRDEQQGDRRRALHLAEDGQRSRLQYPGQARCREPD